MATNAEVRADESPCMTVREAATYLNCKRSHVFHLIHSGELSFAKVGDHFVVQRAEVVAYLERSWRRNGEIEVSKSKIKAINA